MLVEKVLKGTLTAPMRAVASQATTKSGPLGKRRPTRVPAPDTVGHERRGQFRRAQIGLAIGERGLVDGEKHMVRLTWRSGRRAERGR